MARSKPLASAPAPAARGVCGLMANALACALGAGSALPGVAAPVPRSAPSAGTVLKRSSPPPRLPAAPRAIPRLPAPAAQGPKSSIQIPIKKIVIEGNRLVSTPRLQALVAAVVGKTVSLAKLERQVERITHFYHARLYAGVCLYPDADRG